MATNRHTVIRGTRTAMSFTLSENSQPPRVSAAIGILQVICSACRAPQRQSPPRSQLLLPRAINGPGDGNGLSGRPGEMGTHPGAASEQVPFPYIRGVPLGARLGASIHPGAFRRSSEMRSSLREPFRLTQSPLPEPRTKTDGERRATLAISRPMAPLTLSEGWPQRASAYRAALGRTCHLHRVEKDARKRRCRSTGIQPSPGRSASSSLASFPGHVRKIDVEENQIDSSDAV